MSPGWILCAGLIGVSIFYDILIYAAKPKVIHKYIHLVDPKASDTYLLYKKEKGSDKLTLVEDSKKDTI